MIVPMMKAVVLSQPGPIESAFDSREAVERILATTVANVKAFRDGKPQNWVHT